ncbi:hypothetical protein [Jeotgalibacillus aurantiacus]|uniref:hypothetical protein n=1 Tax=Jeotgalibacillus aurantiacus TaxID=2763266 RepID=UPI001D0B80AA|nr:hypothetical protein [Jeotgalibacillus aurantiacus]
MFDELFHLLDANVSPLIVEEKIKGETFVVRTYKNTESIFSKVFFIAINKRTSNMFSTSGESYSDCLKKLHDFLI